MVTKMGFNKAKLMAAYDNSVWTNTAKTADDMTVNTDSTDIRPFVIYFMNEENSLIRVRETDMIGYEW